MLGMIINSNLSLRNRRKGLWWMSGLNPYVGTYVRGNTSTTHTLYWRHTILTCDSNTSEGTSEGASKNRGASVPEGLTGTSVVP